MNQRLSLCNGDVYVHVRRSAGEQRSGESTEREQQRSKCVRYICTTACRPRCELLSFCASRANGKRVGGGRRMGREIRMTFLWALRLLETRVRRRCRLSPRPSEGIHVLCGTPAPARSPARIQREKSGHIAPVTRTLCAERDT